MGRRLVVEADGAARGNPGPASYGAVIRDAATGEVLAELAEALGTATNNVAEYRGLIAGLRAAFELDAQAEVEVRMDSRLVIEQMAGRWSVRHPGLRPLALEVRRLIPDPEQVRWTWVPRERNSHADRLANEALDAAARGERWRPAPRTTPPNGLVEATDRPQPKIADRPEPKIIGWATDLGIATTVWLLRHGETQHTVEKRFSGGRFDPELSEQGLRQADVTAQVLARRGGVDAVITSPLRRAKATAERVAADLRLPVYVEDRFRECDFGDWDGLTFDEVQQRWPEETAAWLASTSAAPPGGESFDEVAERVRAALSSLLERFAGRTLLVVAHVTPIKTVVRLALDAPPHSINRMHLAPASLTTVQYYEDGNCALYGFNDSAHLGSLARLDGA
jgi:ribonuclease H / adenosylcobalamin/alpha-ribazole phosphatase